jgi:hypothetical protein
VIALKAFSLKEVVDEKIEKESAARSELEIKKQEIEADFIAKVKNILIGKIVFVKIDREPIDEFEVLAQSPDGKDISGDIEQIIEVIDIESICDRIDVHFVIVSKEGFRFLIRSEDIVAVPL